MIASMYIDTGLGFNEDEKLQQLYRIDRNNRFTINFEVGSFLSINKIRIDLCDDLCILHDIALKSDAGLDILLNGVLIENKYYFINEKAEVYIQNKKNQEIKYVELSGTMDTPTQLQVELILNEKIKEINNENIRLENFIANKQKEIQSICDLLEEKTKIINEMNKIIEDFQKTNIVKDLYLNNYNEEINDKNLEIEIMLRTIDSKDLELNYLKAEINDKDTVIENLQNEIGNRDINISNIQIEIDNIVNSVSWKITKPLRKIKKKLKKNK